MLSAERVVTGFIEAELLVGKIRARVVATLLPTIGRRRRHVECAGQRRDLVAAALVEAVRTTAASHLGGGRRQPPERSDRKSVV